MSCLPLMRFISSDVICKLSFKCGSELSILSNDTFLCTGAFEYGNNLTPENTHLPLYFRYISTKSSIVRLFS